jgi:ABC-type nitrate/sulfonate/bicarbonate transport system permease component
MNRPRSDLILPLVGPLFLIAIWQLIATGHGETARLLPTPAATFSRAFVLLSDGTLAKDMLSTLGRCAVGFFLARIMQHRLADVV